MEALRKAKRCRENSRKQQQVEVQRYLNRKISSRMETTQQTDGLIYSITGHKLVDSTQHRKR